MCRRLTPATKFGRQVFVETYAPKKASASCGLCFCAQRGANHVFVFRSDATSFKAAEVFVRCFSASLKALLFLDGAPHRLGKPHHIPDGDQFPPSAVLED